MIDEIIHILQESIDNLQERIKMNFPGKHCGQTAETLWEKKREMFRKCPETCFHEKCRCLFPQFVCNVPTWKHVSGHFRHISRLFFRNVSVMCPQSAKTWQNVCRVCIFKNRIYFKKSTGFSTQMSYFKKRRWQPYL